MKKMSFGKDEIEVIIFEYQDKIEKYQSMLRKGISYCNPSEIRNAIVDYKIQITRLEKQMEVR